VQPYAGRDGMQVAATGELQTIQGHANRASRPFCSRFDGHVGSHFRELQRFMAVAGGQAFPIPYSDDMS